MKWLTTTKLLTSINRGSWARATRMMCTPSAESYLDAAKVALCQMHVTPDKDTNLAKAKAMIAEASGNAANLVVLPEVWNSPYATTSFPEYAELVPEVGGAVDKAKNPSLAMLVEAAKAHNIWLVGGSIPERAVDSTGTERLYNTCCIMNPSGEIVGKHRKVHLFDINVPGKVAFRESDSLTAGDDVTVIPTPWGGLGVGICYDIRFPELAMMMRMQGCRMIIYPGAFNMVTGPAHWELLQRARAVDNQVFVAACSPARSTAEGGYVAWGHSSVVSPWGKVMATATEGEEIVYADINFAEAEEMRDNIPCWKQKRNDVYKLTAAK